MGGIWEVHRREMDSGAVMYIPSYIEFFSYNQKLIEEINRHTESMDIAYVYFNVFNIRRAG
jgi:hypothetical protein